MDDQTEMPRVDVAMATYNGARYLPEMLASMASQKWPGLRLVVCDDGSTDGTIEQLTGVVDFPVSLRRNARNLGARDNFSQALAMTEAPYIALADQDDVWLPGKIEAMVGRIQQLERAHGADRPALVYSDLQIVDGELNVIVSSFYNDSFKSREARRLEDFAISNHVPGCALMINRATIDLALPIPPEAQMHDWWLCLVTAAFGHVCHVDAPLLLFRRHGANESGSGKPKARSAWLRSAFLRLGQPNLYLRQRREDTAKLAQEANARLTILNARHRGAMPDPLRAKIDGLTSPRWWRRYGVLRRAHTGESPVTDLLVALQMGRRVNRSAFDAATPDTAR